MATTTTNMGLTKPGLIDTADVGVINSNMDKLDGHSHGGGTDGLPVRVVQSGTTTPAAGTRGALFFNTTDGRLYVDNGSSWQGVGGGEAWNVGEVSSTTPDGTTTVFALGRSGINTASKIRVFKNGLLKSPNTATTTYDYAFTAGASSIAFNTAPTTGDIVAIEWVAA